MNTTHEIISDFLDGEAFEPQALGEALADPAGREMLIDFVVLRYAAQTEEPAIQVTAPAKPSRLRFFLAAAAVIVALVGGYELGHQRGATESTRPPEATRAVPTSVWQTVPMESMR